MKFAYLEAGTLMHYWVAEASGYEPIYQLDSPEGPCVCINKDYDQGELV